MNIELTTIGKNNFLFIYCNNKLIYFYFSEQERLLASHGEVERLRLSNLELQQEAETCRDREAELLNFTQLLTDKNVRLQSEFSATEAKVIGIALIFLNKLTEAFINDRK